MDPIWREHIESALDVMPRDSSDDTVLAKAQEVEPHRIRTRK